VAVLGSRDSNPGFDVQSVACCQLHHSPWCDREDSGAIRMPAEHPWAPNVQPPAHVATADATRVAHE
jgi:hypothetical protein